VVLVRTYSPTHYFAMNSSAAQARSATVQRRILSSTELRARRRALGLTQAGLAAELDMSANTVARWERGELQIGHPRRVLHRLEQLERGSARDDHDAAMRATAGRPDMSQHRVTDDGLAIRGQATRVLPGELSSFVGRQQELRRVRNLLESTRLLTLIGAGGIGKTRLAPELLRELQAEIPWALGLRTARI
jgi:DNA-binding XRE family transcriptional regulator